MTGKFETKAILAFMICSLENQFVIIALTKTRNWLIWAGSTDHERLVVFQTTKYLNVLDTPHAKRDTQRFLCVVLRFQWPMLVGLRMHFLLHKNSTYISAMSPNRP